MVVKTSKLFKISLQKLANCRYCQRQILENILNRKFDMLSFSRTLSYTEKGTLHKMCKYINDKVYTIHILLCPKNKTIDLRYNYVKLQVLSR